MNLVSFGNLANGCPVFLNEDPYTMLGSLKIEQAGENSLITISLDDKAVKLAKRPGRAKGTKQVKAAAATTEAPKRRRKAKSDKPKRTRKKAEKAAEEAGK